MQIIYNILHLNESKPKHRTDFNTATKYQNKHWKKTLQYLSNNKRYDDITPCKYNMWVIILKVKSIIPIGIHGTNGIFTKHDESLLILMVVHVGKS